MPLMTPTRTDMEVDTTLLPTLCLPNSPHARSSQNPVSPINPTPCPSFPRPHTAHKPSPNFIHPYPKTTEKQNKEAYYIYSYNEGTPPSATWLYQWVKDSGEIENIAQT